MFNGTIRRPFNRTAQFITQYTQLSKHTYHNKYKIYQAGNSINSLGIFYKSNNGLSQPQVYCSANKCHGKTNGVACRAQGDMISKMPGYKYSRGYQ